jgi:hypothetical protein
LMPHTLYRIASPNSSIFVSSASTSTSSSSSAGTTALGAFFVVLSSFEGTEGAIDVVFLHPFQLKSTLVRICTCCCTAIVLFVAEIDDALKKVSWHYGI